MYAMRDTNTICSIADQFRYPKTVVMKVFWTSVCLVVLLYVCMRVRLPTIPSIRMSVWNAQVQSLNYFDILKQRAVFFKTN